MDKIKTGAFKLELIHLKENNESPKDFYERKKIQSKINKPFNLNIIYDIRKRIQNFQKLTISISLYFI